MAILSFEPTVYARESHRLTRGAAHAAKCACATNVANVCALTCTLLIPKADAAQHQLRVVGSRGHGIKLRFRTTSDTKSTCYPRVAARRKTEPPKFAKVLLTVEPFMLSRSLMVVDHSSNSNDATSTARTHTTFEGQLSEESKHATISRTKPRPVATSL